MFELHKNGIFYNVDGEIIAKITFERFNNILNVDHTFVDDRLRGQGIASQLVEKLVAYAMENELKINPICWYVEKWFEKHPDFKYLLA